MKERVFLLLGSNQGDSAAQLETARHLIQTELGSIQQASSLYQTAAWGKTDQPDFLNQVLELETSLAPRELLNQMLAIEQQMGRQRLEYMGPRVIDIDLLAYGTRILDEPGLQVPHPRLPLRRFVLIPLAEIAPGWIHPVSEHSIEHLLEICPDRLDVNKFYSERP